MRRRPLNPSYFVVMQDLGGRLGCEAVVDPEITRNEIIRRLKTGEYRDVVFIHRVEDGFLDDVTGELIDAAEALLREEVA